MLPTEGTVIYLAGPMTGYPDCNFPAFIAAATSLRDRGYAVVSPAEIEADKLHEPWVYYLKRDIAIIVQECTAIAVLPGWQTSRGARLEAFVAHSLGLPVVDAATLDPIPASEFPLDFAVPATPSGPMPESILQEAERLVSGPRRAAYGPPLNDFRRTSTIWSAIIGYPVTPQQAILCMIGVKISRECNRPGRDNRVDICGYAACLDLIEQCLPQNETPAASMVDAA